jgi:protein-tyrosine-phosphatase
VTDRPLALLYVCTANICRSAYAEILSRHLLDGNPAVEVASAGTRGYVDAPVDPPMAAELSRRGVNPDGFRSRRLDMRLVAAADLVLTAETSHRQFILDERPELFRRVLTLGQAARIFEQAGAGLEGRTLAEVLRKEFVVPDPADDVSDPYGRGGEAAARAAEQIESHVRRVIGFLTGETMAGR